MDAESHRRRTESLHRLVVDPVLRSYSAVYFSQRRWVGAAILLATMLWPWLGAVGLAGLVIALAASLLFGLDRTLVRSGAYLFNSLLASLALGHAYSHGLITLEALVVVLPITSVITLFLTVAMFSALGHTVGLSPLSLPFVVFSCMMPFLIPASQLSPVDFEPTLTGAHWELLDVPMLEYGRVYLRSFGSILFLPYVEFGALVLLVLLVHSRLLVLHATIAVAVGLAVLSCVPPGITFAAATAMLFNFVYCGIALGGVYFIPSLGTLALVVLGSAICGIVTSVVITAFTPLGFVPMALPLNLVILLVVYVMRLRTSASAIQITPFAPMSPEENFSKFRLSRARFPHASLPTMHCPFLGERVVTQGVDGRLTHRAGWRHALDFEVLNDRERHAGAKELENYYTFNTPVLCPEDGVVTKTVDHVEDRPIGSNNFADNWGNLVIIRFDSGLFATLCHLRQQSLTVKVGERVRRGQIVGYCGNSGRSPVPHLHVQLQISPLVGAATIPFALRHYFEHNGKGLVYRTAGIPRESARIEGATVECRVAKCFDNIARREFRYKLTKGDQVREEVITCTIDELGCYVFESRHRDRLTAAVHEYGFFALDYQGGKNLLFWLWLGLSRVPFITNPKAHWHDELDVRQVLKTWSNAWFDLVGPYWRAPRLTVTGRLDPPHNGPRPNRSEACIETVFECDAPSLMVSRNSIPRRICTYVARNDWVAAAVVELDEPLFIEQIH